MVHIMKTKLLTICLLLINSKIFALDDLSGKNLFCEEHNLFVTYSFFDHKRYQTTNYFLIYFDIGIISRVYLSILRTTCISNFVAADK